MLRARDYRERARASLGNDWTGDKWVAFTLIALIYYLIEGGIASTSVIAIGALAGIAVEGPLQLGFAYISLDAVRGGRAEFENFFKGFKRFLPAFLLYLLNTLFIFLWSLLFIIPGIVMSYAYSMSYFILSDCPEMTASDARIVSVQMMRGNKWRLFCLMFSFIGWDILSVLTLGILQFWVMPYKQTALAAFYESIKGDFGKDAVSGSWEEPSGGKTEEK